MKFVVPIALLSWVFLACLGTPEKREPRPYSRSSDCGEPGQVPLDIDCREPCSDSRTCPQRLWCTFVEAIGPGEGNRVCIDYTHCAFLSSDTQCVVTEAGGMATCSGNALWQIEDLVGDPACGRAHEVVRCQPVQGRCELVRTETYDVGSP